jgi:hypothetical protein
MMLAEFWFASVGTRLLSSWGHWRYHGYQGTGQNGDIHDEQRGEKAAAWESGQLPTNWARSTCD